MMTPQFREILQLFDSYEEIDGSNFRPVASGVRAVDLHPLSLKPRIAIGNKSMSLIRLGATANELKPTMTARIEHLRSVRRQPRPPSLESQFEARLIRAAQLNGLVLDEFPASMRFVHSQWRIGAFDCGTQQFSDLLGVDLSTSRLVVIELKAGPDASAAEQALRYARYFEARGGELLPFFEQVARMMGSRYGCVELAQVRLSGVEPSALVAWPLERGMRVERVLGAASVSGAVAARASRAPST
jgi:hypothetical protein